MYVAVYESANFHQSVNRFLTINQELMRRVRQADIHTSFSSKSTQRHCIAFSPANFSRIKLAQTHRTALHRLVYDIMVRGAFK